MDVPEQNIPQLSNQKSKMLDYAPLKKLKYTTEDSCSIYLVQIWLIYDNSIIHPY